MANRKAARDEIRRQPPAITVEAREEQLVGLAINLAEKQLLEGTAKPSVIVHYLKLGSSKEKLEKELLAEQIKVAEAKAEALKSAKRVEELYEAAMRAMRKYGGQDEEPEY